MRSRNHRAVRAAVTAVAVASTLLRAGPATAAFSDVPSGHWAASAISYVAEQRNWMRDFGSTEFRPEARLQRRHLARAVVRAFARSEPTDPSITFTDLPSDDPFFPFANVAVKLGWMSDSEGAFLPRAAVTKIDLDRALVKALGLTKEIAGLASIRTEDGYRFRRPKGFAVLALGLSLRLHHNHPGGSEGRELLPGSRVRRADAAFALRRAHRVRMSESWRLSAASRYRDVTLPAMGEARRAATEFALAHVGWPYVYAGEWYRKTPAGYCCGAQVRGGFDCSGFVWWVLRAPGEGWDNTEVRPYPGWRLVQRSSSDMARATRNRLGWRETRPMDVMFFDPSGGDGWAGVSHAGLFLGNGWVIDSSNGQGGVTISWAAEGWHRDSFVWSRRVIR
ncbi:MAG: C40 family peptidase [Actinomycetota bacterium]